MMKFITINKASEILGRSESDVRYYIGKGVIVNNGVMVEEGSVNTLKEILDRDSDNREALRKILERKKSFDAVMNDFNRCEEDLKKVRKDVINEIRLMGLKYQPQTLLRLIVEIVGEKVLNKKEMYVMENLSAYDDFGKLGESLGLTRERVRQIFERSVRKMSDYDFEAEYKHYEDIENENEALRREKEELLKEVAVLKGKVNSLGSKDMANVTNGESLKAFLSTKNMSEYDLSVRTKNFLVTNDIGTVADLVGYSHSQLLRLPRCGNVTLSDLSKVLSDVSREIGINISFGMNFESDGL